MAWGRRNIGATQVAMAKGGCRWEVGQAGSDCVSKSDKQVVRSFYAMYEFKRRSISRTPSPSASRCLIKKVAEASTLVPSLAETSKQCRIPYEEK